MNIKEAKQLANSLNKDIHLTAKVVRILPVYVDPAKDGDNGWDVEVIDNSPPAVSGEGWSY